MAKTNTQFVNVNGVKIRKNKTAAQLAEQMNRIGQAVAHAGYREGENGEYTWQEGAFDKDWTDRHQRISDMNAKIRESKKGIITDTDDYYRGPEYKGDDVRLYEVANPKNANATVGKLAGSAG